MDIIQKRTLRVVESFKALVPLAFQGVLDMSKKSGASEREITIAYHYWISGKLPSYMSRYSQETRYLGQIASEYFKPEKVQNITPQEERAALKLLSNICRWIFTEWASKAYARLWIAAGSVEMSAIRIQMAQLKMNIKHSYEYISLLRVLFP